MGLVGRKTLQEGTCWGLVSEAAMWRSLEWLERRIMAEPGHVARGDSPASVPGEAVAGTPGGPIGQAVGLASVGEGYWIHLRLFDT